LSRVIAPTAIPLLLAALLAATPDFQHGLRADVESPARFQAPGAQGGAASAQDLAQALQRKYDAIRDFSADFAQSYRGGVLRKEIVERGHLMVKRPGKMRWQYLSPEEKVFVSDGVKGYFYLPLDKQVIVSSIPSDDQITTPTMFLAGKGNLVRDFSASIVEPLPGAPPGTRALKLVPRSQQRDYDWLMLEVAPQTLELRGLVTVDAQGGQSRISFTNLKENTGLTDKDFTFKMPRGVDVVTDPPAR
jgi:outer membrane lipoprotein carrier protein